MAKNDVLLLDQLVKEFSQSLALPVGEAFETFAIKELLKDRDLSPDELSLGLVDGRDDGGVDGWYTFVDGELLSDPEDLPAKREVAKIDVVVFTVKHHSTFKQEPVIALNDTLSRLFDLSVENEDLASLYNEALLLNRGLFKDALVKTARCNPALSITVSYVSRGDTQQIGSSITVRSDALLQRVDDFFSNCLVEFKYIGATELLSVCRKLKDFSSVLRFEESPVSRGLNNYVGLVRLADYVKFISDPSGQLRRYLFEANVRDYMGETFVNNSILSTLRQPLREDGQDFWWLNNGVTVVCDEATLLGKQLHLQNVKIVNGLQTTETVYKYFVQQDVLDDSRCILVKVLVAPEKELADNIILATNNQNKVDVASLRATDKIQRDIEDLLFADGWFYDRRKNYYSNSGKPFHRIVSMKYMAWSILATKAGRPDQCNRARPKQLLMNSQYTEVFSESFDLRMYP